MPITPLPQFETDLAEHLAEQADREAYERLNAPKTVVVRFGAMKMVGEYPWSSDVKPGCGSKLVVRTHRGTEIGEMLTSTCPNSGCSKSVTRKDMLTYIENSGGRDYPFFAKGRALRVADKGDMDRQTEIDEAKPGLRKRAQSIARTLGIPLKIVEVEPVLGGESVTYFYTSEDRVDHRPLLQELRPLHDCRVDVRHVGARDEARLTADYERCGQYCCCKNFLKVLKPISMRSAKVQKQTLDPLKISGRCGRLMCCLRYEDETYDQLRRNLPRKGKRVGTPDGDGEIIDTQILTQLALVRLDTGEQGAFAIEDLADPAHATKPDIPMPTKPPSRGRGGRQKPARESRESDQSGAAEAPPGSGKGGRRRRKRPGSRAETPANADTPPTTGTTARSQSPPPEKKRRRRRRRGGGDGDSGTTPGGEQQASDGPPSQTDGSNRGKTQTPPSHEPRPDAPGRRRRRRRRKPNGGPGGSADGNAPGDS